MQVEPGNSGVQVESVESSAFAQLLEVEIARNQIVCTAPPKGLFYSNFIRIGEWPKLDAKPIFGNCNFVI